MFDDLRRQYVDLAQPRLGSEVVYATDDFFADKARLIAPEPPLWVPGKYDDNGKWMDGWESRRKRTPGHDWCVVRLGVPGEIAGFEIDTSHFTGNYPPGAELEVCRSDEAVPG
ncbi:MAG: allantoicase, partial [Phenylobacterium sp.]|nr:allantoicase [Phenylobacterium sp.]